MRLRHELFEKWLNEKASIQHVLKYLKTANFNPEFFKSFEKEILESFNQEFDESITLAPKKWWRKILHDKV